MIFKIVHNSPKLMLAIGFFMLAAMIFQAIFVFEGFETNVALIDRSIIIVNAQVLS
jgi:hypothetical protein